MGSFGIPSENGTVRARKPEQMVRLCTRLTVATLAVALGILAAGAASAAEPPTLAPDPSASIFDCPPPQGIYPEPDPCVSIPPTPDIPVFALPVDSIPEVPEWYCDPATKPGVAEVRGLLHSTYGVGGSTHRACNVTWSYEFSLHKMGLALDWGVDAAEPEEWAAGLSLLRWLLAADDEGNEFAIARRIGITQLIWHNRVWTSANPVWRIYCDPRDPEDASCFANPTLRHEDHMHISFSLEAGYLRTSYFQALGFRPIAIPPPPELPEVEADMTSTEADGS
jgi:hypothetical protein